MNPHSGSQICGFSSGLECKVCSGIHHTNYTNQPTKLWHIGWMHELCAVFVCMFLADWLFLKEKTKQGGGIRERDEAEVMLYCGISNMSAAALWGYRLILARLSTGHNSLTTSKSSAANAEGNSGASMNRDYECAASAYWNCLNFNKQGSLFQPLFTSCPSDPGTPVLMH